MRRTLTLILVSLIALILTTGSTVSQELTATQILKKADEVINAPKDFQSRMRTILIDKDGSEKVRESESYQKGSDKRLVKFLSPADQKGIGFLSLPDDVQYVYLPAFRKVRRVASSIKNTKFAGTDFTYEELSTFEYSKENDAKLIETTKDTYVLELTPKSSVNKDYSKLIMFIRKYNFYPIKIEGYDKDGNLQKVLERRKIEKIGDYWVSREMEMKDLKTDHATKMVIDEIKLDIGLDDDIFTPRYLSRTR